MTDLPTDIRQVSVNRVTIGVIISTAVLAGSISWSSSRLVSRLDAVEATVEAIQDSMDMQSFARVEDTTEDIWAELDDLNDKLDGSWTRWASSGWRTSSPGGLTTENHS